MNTNIDWTKPVAMKRYPAVVGRMQPDRTLSDRRRVMFPIKGQDWPTDKREMSYTVWHFDDKGISRVDGRPSDDDLVNVG